MRILVTCFEPFGGDPENASREAARALADTWDDAVAELVVVELPVVFDGEPFRDAVAEHAPDAVLCIGEAGRRRAITPERWAANEMTARIPDNAGRQPEGEPIVDGGTERLAAAVDPDDVVAALRTAGWATDVSDDAGRYVCNFIAHHAYGLGLPALFVHVPAIRSEGEASVGRETDGVETAASGREPRTFDDLGDALAVVVETLVRRPDASTRRRVPATTA